MLYDWPCDDLTPDERARAPPPLDAPPPWFSHETPRRERQFPAAIVPMKEGGEESTLEPVDDGRCE